MYAVIATGGKQYRVRVGETLDVEKLDAAPNASVSLRPLMVVDDDGSVSVGSDALANAAVTATIVEQRRAPKVTVFKYKSKTGYRRKAGHRQALTRIRVDEINT
jgi:large subunit ribosomal protein L21